MISQAVILCGGLGTRLGALTSDTPKPLLEVGGKPFLETLLFEVARHGFRSVLFLAGFAGQHIVEYAASSRIAREFGLELDVVVEDTPAGTGGSLWLARSRLETEFLLMNGDSWFDINLRALTAHLLADPEAVGVLALRQVEDGSRYGTVFATGNRIVRYAARPAQGGPALVSAGVYAFRRSLVGRLVSLLKSSGLSPKNRHLASRRELQVKGVRSKADMINSPFRGSHHAGHRLLAGSP